MKKILIIITLLVSFSAVLLPINVEAKLKIKKYSLKSQKQCWKPRGEKKVN